MEFQHAVLRRRMVRDFTDEPVERALLEQLLANATRGPSAGFSQGYAFVVLTDAEKRRMFWETTSGPAWRGESESESLTRAPVVILPLANKQAYLDRYALPDKAHTPLSSEEHWPAPYWDIDTGFGVMLMLLTATDLGLGALFFAVFEGERALLDALGVPEAYPADRGDRGGPPDPGREHRAGAPVGTQAARRRGEVGPLVTAYDRIGAGYSSVRQPDTRIGAQVRAALGDAAPVLNVGAGAGSYEPVDLDVVAVEPSLTMLGQRPNDAAPAVRALAERLPFPTRSFAAGMAILTVHHWGDAAAGLAELRRVVRGPVAVLSWDAAVFDDYWMVAEYVPESRTLDRAVPSPGEIAELLGGGVVEAVPVPADCTDGFYAAWWRRPEGYLDPAVRAGISGLARLDPRVVDAAIANLEEDIASGLWSRRHADLLALDTFDAGYRLVTSRPAGH